ncbi:MAG: hypothetical protein KIT72_10555 [Polyangiaceae bacterium]|nr:hypothetical protein [Polyangiaceae bacterium]MCW5790853.1 hypothetical protein [Polyangiaceae bacterium]
MIAARGDGGLALRAGRACAAPLVALLFTGVAAAQSPRVSERVEDASSAPSSTAGADAAPGVDAAPRAASPAALGPAFELYVGGVLGTGLRFNNPYRLATPLGDDPGGLSRSAVYTDLHVGAQVGPALGFQHGAQLGLAVALEGIPQEVLTLSYVLERRFGPRLSAALRLGVPIVLTPDSTVGLEAGLVGLLALTGGLSATAELSYSQFYGAATHEVSPTVIPILAGALGLRVAFEALP